MIKKQKYKFNLKFSAILLKCLRCFIVFNYYVREIEHRNDNYFNHGQLTEVGGEYDTENVNWYGKS